MKALELDPEIAVAWYTRKQKIKIRLHTVMWTGSVPIWKSTAKREVREHYEPVFTPVNSTE